MDSAGVSYCCLGWALPSDVGSAKHEQHSTNCAAPKLAEESQTPSCRTGTALYQVQWQGMDK